MITKKSFALWEATEGVGLGLSGSDTKENIARYLERNPGMSSVAVMEERIVGRVLCGHDGRRGSLHHLAVSRECRGQGIARKLLVRCFRRLQRVNILKCNIFPFAANVDATAFWRHDGWTVREDLRLVQK